MGEGLGVTFLDLWRAEFHAGKELRAKSVGLPDSAVAVPIQTVKPVHGGICLQNRSFFSSIPSSSLFFRCPRSSTVKVKQKLHIVYHSRFCFPIL